MSTKRGPNTIPRGELQRLSKLTRRSVSHLSRVLRGERPASPELAELLYEIEYVEIPLTNAQVRRVLGQSQGPEDAHPGP